MSDELPVLTGRQVIKILERHGWHVKRISGTGTKASGPDYLLHFVEPRVVTENTMRHGLVA